MRIRDPGWKKIGSGMEKIRVWDKPSRIRNTAYKVVLQTRIHTV